MPRQQRHCRTTFACGLALWLIVTGGRCTAAVAADATEAPARSPRGITWSDDRALEQRLTALFDESASGDLAMRLNLLRDITQADPLTLVSHESLQVPLHERTREWVASLDESERKQYVETFEPIAAREWARAAPGPLESKMAFALRYRETATGGAAARGVAAELVDRGRYAEAIVWCRRVRKHRLIAEEHRRQALLRQVVCHLRLGVEEIAVAEALWREYQEGVPRGDANQETTVSRWIDAEIAEQRRRLASLSIRPSKQVAREPAWQQRTTMISDVQDLLNDALAEYREQGWLDLPVVQPLLLGERVVVPQINRLVCYRLKDGEMLWRTPPETSLYEPGGESARDLQNSGFRHMLAQTLLQQVQRDAMTATLSTDGELVFAVREWPSESLSRTDAETRAENESGGNAGSRFSRNRLLAYDQASGDQRWELRYLPRETLDALEIAVSDQNHGVLPSVLFLGPPLGVRNDLYAVAQLDADLLLVSIDAASGGVKWAYRLATIADEEDHQLPRRGTRAVLHHRSGRLYGATGRGLVFAFDLGSRCLAWGQATGRDDWERPGNVQMLRSQRGAIEEWWMGWRDSFVEMTDRDMIVATPDMDWVRSYDYATGKLNWEYPRGEGLFVSERLGDRMLIVEPTHIDAIAVADGKRLWRQPTAIPAGRGCALASGYLLPLQNRMWLRVLPEKGRAEIVDGIDSLPLGNMFTVAGGVLALQHDQVALYPDWQTARDKVEADHQGEPDSLTSIKKLARLHFEAGDFERSAGHWHNYLARQTDAALLRASQQEFLRERLAELRWHPDRLPALHDELLSLGQAVEAMPSVHVQLAEAHRRRGEPAESLSLLLAAAEQPQSDREHVDVLTSRTMRWNRYVQGHILDLLAQMGDNDRHELNRQLDAAAAKATASADGFAPGRFAERFSFLPQGRSMRLKTARQWGVGARLHHVELALRDLAMHDDSTTAAQAYVALADVLWEKSFRSDAVSIYRQFGHEFGGLTLASGQTTEQFLENLKLPERYAQELKSGRGDPWSPQIPTVSRADESYTGSVDWVIVPLECDQFSLWNRMTVGVDRRGRTLRLQSPDEPDAWELKLPASTSMFRFVYPMHRAWGIGRLLVLQVGADLLGISPWNERGEPQAEVVWYLEGYPRRQPQINDLGIRRAPVRMGIREPMLEVLDQFGRIVGDFGPIGPGQFYLFRNGQLEARETATASLVWEKKLVKPYTRCQADAEFIFLYRHGHRELEILRAVDGKTIAVGATPVDPSEFLVSEGRYVLISEAATDGNLVLSWHSLLDNSVVWRHDAPDGTIPFTTDGETIGLLQPGGVLKLLSLSSGKPQAEQTIETPIPLSNIHCVVTERQFVIALTKPLDDPAKLAATELRIDHRRPLINGRLLALDRSNGELLWQRAIGDTAIPLDQPRGVPLLVFNHWEKRRDGKDQLQDVGVIRFLDLRTGGDIVLAKDDATGEDIIQAEGDGWGDHFALSLDAEQGRIEVHSSQRTITLVYPAAKK